jgi:hypothetical protein
MGQERIWGEQTEKRLTAVDVTKNAVSDENLACKAFGINPS